MNGLGVDQYGDRSVQFYLVEMTAAESADYITYEEVFDHIAARDVFSDENIASRIEAFRSEHRSRFYYDIARPGRDVAKALHDLAEQIHQYLVEFADAHSRCNCDHPE